MPKCWSIEDAVGFFSFLQKCVQIGYEKLPLHEGHTKCCYSEDVTSAAAR
jgi:hypothetical protein